MRRTRFIVLLVGLVLLLGGASAGCASTVELGSISAQQRGPGYGVQWGVYPNTPAVRYVVDIYVNNRRFDHKDQAYPPHGSVPGRTIRTGDIFRLEGRATNARGDVGIFYLTCKAA